MDSIGTKTKPATTLILQRYFLAVAANLEIARQLQTPSVGDYQKRLSRVGASLPSLMRLKAEYGLKLTDDEVLAAAFDSARKRLSEVEGIIAGQFSNLPPNEAFREAVRALE
jgi:hypothetical protein